MKCSIVKRLNLLCFVVIAIIGGLSQGFAQEWPNMPVGSTVLTTNPLNDACSGVSGWSCDYQGGGTIVGDAAPGSGATPPNSLQYTETASTTSNGGNYSVVQYQFPRGIPSLYVGFWMKLSDPYYGRGDVCMNKVSLLFNDPINGVGTGGKFYDFEFGAVSGVCQNPPDKQWKAIGVLNYYQDNLQAGAWGNQNFYGNNNVTFGSGEWVRIELCHIASTTPSSANGQYHLWINGRLSISVKNLNHPGNFTGWSLNPVWDSPQAGSFSTFPAGASEYQRFDTVILATGFTTVGAGDPATLTITSSLPSTTQAGKPYSATLQAANGKAPYGWTISAGSLPPGLTLNKTTGAISGIPTTAGISNFTARVMDSSVPAAEATQAYKIIVSGSTGIAAGRATVNGSRLTARPGTESVTFRMPETGAYTLIVFDFSGREVWRHAGAGEAIWNHGGNLKRGVYMVRAEQSGNTFTANYCHVW